MLCSVNTCRFSMENHMGVGRSDFKRQRSIHPSPRVGSWSENLTVIPQHLLTSINLTKLKDLVFLSERLLSKKAINHHDIELQGIIKWKLLGSLKVSLVRGNRCYCCTPPPLPCWENNCVCLKGANNPNHWCFAKSKDCQCLAWKLKNEVLQKDLLRKSGYLCGICNRK